MEPTLTVDEELGSLLIKMPELVESVQVGGRAGQLVCGIGAGGGRAGVRLPVVAWAWRGAAGGPAASTHPAPLPTPRPFAPRPK
jgi:hypothetical protein